jgi:hypothetical protein
MHSGASGAPGAVAGPERLFPVAVACLVALNVIVQKYNLGRTVIPGLDEGMYLYAAKLIVHGAVPYRHYVADSKFFQATGKNMDERSFQDLLARSGSVAVEPYLASFLDRRRWETLAGSFTLVFRRGAYQAWVKKTP